MSLTANSLNLHKEGVQLRHIGRLERLAPNLQKKVLDAIELTKNNDRLVLNVAFNYGGRDEIVNAIQNIMKDGIAPEDVTEVLGEPLSVYSRCTRPGSDHPSLRVNCASVTS